MKQQVAMRKYFIYASVGVTVFLATFCSASVAVALTDIRSDFHSSILLVGWVLSGYLLTYTIGVALGGRVSDVFGQKPVYTLCLLIFILGALLCWLAPNVELLILFRLIQGFGAGGLTSISFGIVVVEFPSARQKAIGFLSSIFALGSLAGPNVAGWIVTEWGWRSVFWINIQLLLIAFLILTLMLRPGKRKESHIDVPGAIMLAAWLSAIMVSLSLIRKHGTPWVWVIALLIIGIAIIVIFIRRENRVSHPILDPQFLRTRAFAASNAFNLLFGVSLVVGSCFVPMYAVAVYKETTLTSGVIMTPRSLCMVLISAITAQYVFKLGYRWPLLLGSAAMGISYVLLAIQPEHLAILGLNLGGTDFLFLFMALCGLGVGGIMAVANNVCVDLAPQQAATVSGIRGMFLNIGGSIGTVVASLVLNHYDKDMSYGFYLVYMGLALISLISVPFLFFMPSRPSAPSSVKHK
jgi:EmrB/QacA subfamily drug resistance transporter